MKWFRVYSEIKDDPKLLELDDHQRWLWICLLALASESPQRGVLLGVRLRGLAASLRTDEDRLRLALTAFAELDMLVYDEAARTIAIVHWESRQYDKPSDTPSATRDRKQRSRRSHAAVTPSHATDTDTDTDTDPDPDTELNMKHLTPPPPRVDETRARTARRGGGGASTVGADGVLQAPDDLSAEEFVAWGLLLGAAPDFGQSEDYIRTHSPYKVALWSLAVAGRPSVGNPAGLIRTLVDSDSSPQVSGAQKQAYYAMLARAESARDESVFARIEALEGHGHGKHE